jgi:hypothetical protein
MYVLIYWESTKKRNVPIEKQDTLNIQSPDPSTISYWEDKRRAKDRLQIVKIHRLLCLKCMYK